MNIKFYTISLFAAALLMGCTNLDEEVYSEIPVDHFFKTEKQLVANAARAYTKLQNYCTEQSLWTLNLQVSDECTVPVNANGSWAEQRYRELQYHQFTASNKLIKKGWDFCFDGIASCNEVIYETQLSKINFD
ncbi:MAG: RagB/SusD family nutrient uptake outer membrane protein, partial [Bacteroidota bacterium]|nr:RagB/SusD family nutrient uptake outer membrane protein [Bacteroidota bacterium]